MAGSLPLTFFGYVHVGDKPYAITIGKGYLAVVNFVALRKCFVPILFQFHCFAFLRIAVSELLLSAANALPARAVIPKRTPVASFLLILMVFLQLPKSSCQKR